MQPTHPILEIRAARPDDAPVLVALLTELGFSAPAATIAERLGYAATSARFKKSLLPPG